jgi:hypothetical protein
MNILDRLKAIASGKQPAQPTGVQSAPSGTNTLIPVPAQQEKAPSTCGGCAGKAYEQAIDFGVTIKNLAGFIAGMALNDKVDPAEFRRRRSVCISCTAVDTKGDRLFRKIKIRTFTCGIPRTKLLFRISSVDGCGCWLNLKWWGRDQHCPLKEPKW